MSAQPELPLLRPPALRAGDCIGVCAPSGPVDEAVLDRTLAHWTEQGYALHCAAHLRGRAGRPAGRSRGLSQSPQMNISPVLQPSAANNRST